jgi:vanillate O-demethylase monooxygenase subunit
MIMDTKDLIDRWQIASWTAPSFNMTTTGGKRRGATKEDGYVGRVLHMLTPETEHSTHYFYSFSRNFRISDKDLNEQLLRALSQTFDEDKQLLALQQRELVETDRTIPTTVALRVDNGPMRARRILAARIRREIEGQAASGDLQESPIVEFDT